MHRNRNLCNSFFMANMASRFYHRSMYPATATMMMLNKVTAIPQTIQRVVNWGSRSHFTENKTVLSQFTKNKIGISPVTEKKGERFSLNKSYIPLHFEKLCPKQSLPSCCHSPSTSHSTRCKKETKFLVNIPCRILSCPRRRAISHCFWVRIQKLSTVPERTVLISEQSMLFQGRWLQQKIARHKNLTQLS